MQIKNVAVGGILLWNDVSVAGIHAFAQHLFQRGCNVAYYTAPLSPLHLLSTMGLFNKQFARAHRQRFAYWREGAHRQDVNGARMTARVAMSLVHPARTIPFLDGSFVLRNYLSWRVPSLQNRSLRDGIGPIDTVLFDAGVPEMYYTFAKTAQLSIYRVNDLAGEFLSQVPSRIEAEKEVIRKCDLVFPVSQALYDSVVQIRGTSSNVFLLPNGFDGSLFAEQHPMPPEYDDIPAPRAILIGGNFGECYDWDLLLGAARLCPEVSFVIIGRRGVPKDLPANVHYLGVKPHDRMPAFLQHAHVGLIPFLDMHRIRRIERPLKFYEYLACGLQIVSVPYGSMRAMASHALFATTPEGFAEAVAEAVQVAPQERAIRIESAAQFSWSATMDAFEQTLSDQGIAIAPAQEA